MDFNILLKSLRESSGLSRPDVVKLLKAQGVRTSISTLKRIENGSNSETLNIVFALFSLYHSRGVVKPGLVEHFLLFDTAALTFKERLQRFICNNIQACDMQQLDAIKEIITKPES